MPATLCNPQSPTSSAQYLVGQHELRPALKPQVTPVLARWLAKHSDCRKPAGAPEAGWSEAAKRAHAQGQPVDRFRLAQAVTDKVCPVLKSLRLAEKHAESHESTQVRQQARAVLNGLSSGRIDWDQIAGGLAELRSRVRVSGNRRARMAAWHGEEVIPLSNGKTWKRITTVQRLQTLGIQNSHCTAPSHPAAKHYARALRRATTRFYELVGARGEFLGLVSIDEASMTVEEARGPHNALLKAETDEVRGLLGAIGASVGHAPDMVRIGMAQGFLDVDREDPEFDTEDFSVWFGKQGSMLLRHKDGWTHLRSAGEGFVSVGDYDADDLLGALLSSLRPNTPKAAENAEEKEEEEDISDEEPLNSFLDDFLAEDVEKEE